jgi:predicted TIM-barrel fold metal-dependent hydrolase
VLGGESLGSKFPSPNETQAAQHLARYGRAVDTPQAAREMDDVQARLAHMDQLGIDIQVLHNSMWITPVTNRPDVEIALCWAWNRWMADVWKAGGGRLRWACVVPALSPTEMIPQIQFSQQNGAVAVCMRPFEKNRMMTDPAFYPVYEEAQRLDLAIAVHLGNGSPDLMSMLANESGGGFSTFRVPTVTACYALIMSELPRVFPKLRWGFIEVSSQWVPWVIHETIRRSTGGDRPVSTNPLREYNIYVSTQTDDDFPYVISYAGEDNLVIGTDYGHGDTSSELNAISRFQAMTDISEVAKRKIRADNPRALYAI